MTTALRYRIYEDKDLEPVLHLWEHYSGWGAITKRQFDEWHVYTPHGRCLIIVAIGEKNEIVGQIVFIPSIVTVEGREIKAYRGSAPILNNSYRQASMKDFDHPAFAMIRYGLKVAKEQGYGLVYAFPASGWVPLFNSFPRYGFAGGEVCSYDCFSISLKDASTFQVPEARLSITVLDKIFDGQYYELWNDALIKYPIICGVQRSCQWLQWKLGSHLVLVARSKDNNQLQGYVAINKKSGLIVDMLARTKDELKEVLLSVIHFLHHLNPCKFSFQLDKLTGMITESIQPALQHLPFQIENFTFAFACYPLDPFIHPHSVQASNWYMMPND
jgi:hypothetical protein